ncbi:MAG: hypothetical protein KF852_16860 [Saprospiraceae bacterium]|nr:hypothetical protein [Saprospiraceae bacterium]
MKTVSLPIPTLLLLLFSITLSGQDVQKTLVRAFDVGGASELSLDLDGPVVVQTWSNSMVRVQMQITLSNVTGNMLQSLIASGRYNLKGAPEGNNFIISAPAMHKTVRVGDAELAERVSYTVFVPEKASVIILGVSSEETVAEGTALTRKPM